MNNTTDTTNLILQLQVEAYNAYIDWLFTYSPWAIIAAIMMPLLDQRSPSLLIRGS
jgi:hypothetical protein